MRFGFVLAGKRPIKRTICSGPRCHLATRKNCSNLICPDSWYPDLVNYYEMALIPALDLHKLYTVSQLHINKSHYCVFRRMIYTPTPPPFPPPPTSPPPSPVPFSYTSSWLTVPCLSAPVHGHTHTRAHVAGGMQRAQKKRPRATCSVGERPLILSQREWACWGISAGLWVAQKDGGQGKGRQARTQRQPERERVSCGHGRCRTL